MSTTTKTARAGVSTGAFRQAFEDVPLGRTGAELVIPISSLLHTTGVPLTVAETAGGFNISLGSELLKAQGEICDNETEVSVSYAQVALPANYVAGTDLVVRIPCAIIKSDAGNDDGSTVDLSAFKQASGAVGSDLVTTAAQTFAAEDTWYNKDFTVAGAGLAPGSVLNLKISASVIDDEAGGGTLRFNMDAPVVLLTTEG